MHRVVGGQGGLVAVAPDRGLLVGGDGTLRGVQAAVGGFAVGAQQRQQPSGGKLLGPGGQVLYIGALHARQGGVIVRDLLRRHADGLGVFHQTDPEAGVLHFGPGAVEAVPGAGKGGGFAVPGLGLRWRGRAGCGLLRLRLDGRLRGSRLRRLLPAGAQGRQHGGKQDDRQRSFHGSDLPDGVFSQAYAEMKRVSTKKLRILLKKTQKGACFFLQLPL